MRELDEEPQTSEREGYPPASFMMESPAISTMREIEEEELDEEPQTSEREGYPPASFMMESPAISTMREIKEEMPDEEPQTSERDGYQIVYIKQELNDEDTWQDDGAQMQIHVPVKTESSSESDGNPTFQECNQDSGSQLSEEDGEQDDRGGVLPRNYSLLKTALIEVESSIIESRVFSGRPTNLLN
ncbi:uncharacterized protein LOC115920361 [Strongylocentrotus purpuratus]|uniref:Uncharacterized protein n=1 Tax=Strongylocentrotus purpuratus TaxID=7668 RepID=A0A7M7N6J4_STRPU|nr:uncharacterized protein LOC115920361 [Strongylocentrotus purpuratus]